MEEFSLPIIEEGPGAANPAVFPNTVYNAAGGQVAIKLGALGVGLDGHRRARGGRAGALTTRRPDVGRPGRRGALHRAPTRSPTPSSTATASSALLGGVGGHGAAASRSRRRGRAGARAPRRPRRAARASTASCSATAITSRRARASGRSTAEGAGVERAMRLALERGGRGRRRRRRPSGRARPASRSRRRGRGHGDRAGLRRRRRGARAEAQLGEPMGAGASLNTALALQAGSTAMRPSARCSSTASRSAGRTSRLRWRRSRISTLSASHRDRMIDR